MADDRYTDLEVLAVEMLAKHAGRGSVSAATAAIAAIEKLRKTRHAQQHEDRMRDLAKDPPGMARYLATLGLSSAEAADRIGHKMTPAERKAWEIGQRERLLEIRAIELGRMRRGDGEVPRWAGKKLD